MDQIKETVQEAVSTLKNGTANLKLRKEKQPEWLPVQFANDWDKTDLTYPFCVKLFGNLEAMKREKLPRETARIWFIEFVRMGWTKKMLQARYDALRSTKIYGIEKLEIADWINAVPVMAMDEVNLIVNRRIESMIARGRYLKDKDVKLTEEEKRAVDLAVAKEIEIGYKAGWYEARETYQEERKRRIIERYSK